MSKTRRVPIRPDDAIAQFDRELRRLLGAVARTEIDRLRTVPLVLPSARSSAPRSRGAAAPRARRLKNHMIVLPDADMELAADAAVSAGYGSAGERCMAISVVVAVGSAADKLVPLMKQRIARLVVGDGLEPGSEMGPLIG